MASRRSSRAEEEDSGDALKHLSAEELQEFREIFQLVDKDGGGTISCEELAELMETLGINAPRSEVEAMIAEIDQDNSGEIDFEEFVSVMSRKVNASYSAEQVKSAFKIFEGSAPAGHIRMGDLVHALTTYGGEKLTEDEARDLVSQLEPDVNGLFHYEEFVTVMMSDPGATKASPRTGGGSGSGGGSARGRGPAPPSTPRGGGGGGGSVYGGAAGSVAGGGGGGGGGGRPKLTLRVD